MIVTFGRTRGQHRREVHAEWNFEPRRATAPKRARESTLASPRAYTTASVAEPSRDWRPAALERQLDFHRWRTRQEVFRSLRRTFLNRSMAATALPDRDRGEVCRPRADLLPTSARRQKRQGFRLSQISHDGGRSCTAICRPIARRPANGRRITSSEATPALPRSALSCARPVSMSCRSCSTF